MPARSSTCQSCPGSYFSEFSMSVRSSRPRKPRPSEYPSARRSNLLSAGATGLRPVHQAGRVDGGRLRFVLGIRGTTNCCLTCVDWGIGRAHPLGKRSLAKWSHHRRGRVDTERNLLDILDRVDAIRLEAVDQTHLFSLARL